MSGRACAGCSAPSKLQCPVCLKSSILALSPASYFCSQDCFKKSWADHKVLHAVAAESSAKAASTALEQAASGNYNPWPGYKFTGPLRPWPYGPVNSVPAHIKKPDYAATGFSKSEAMERGSNRIHVCTEEEIEASRRVGKIGRAALDLGAEAVRAGTTTHEIDRIIHEFIISEDAYPSPFNYNNFPRSCCTSLNEVICHGIPDMRPLKEGDILNIDVSVYMDGMHTDLNEMYFVGEVDDAAKNLVYTARECLELAIDMVKPTVPYRDVGSVIQKHATQHGLSVVRAFCGHGVNGLFHATPNIPHYAKNKAVGVMRPGHIFTIEPMINEGAWQEAFWPDDWTATTIDGKRSAQFEQTMVVTEDGVEITTASKQFADSSFSSPYPPAYAHLRPSSTSNARPAPAAVKSSSA